MRTRGAGHAGARAAPPRRRRRHLGRADRARAASRSGGELRPQRRAPELEIAPRLVRRGRRALPLRTHPGGGAAGTDRECRDLAAAGRAPAGDVRGGRARARTSTRTGSARRCSSRRSGRTHTARCFATSASSRSVTRWSPRTSRVTARCGSAGCSRRPPSRVGSRAVEIRKVGVVGLGTMGAGIAQVSVQAGFETVGREVSEELAERGRATVDRYLTRAVEKGRMTEADRDAALARLTLTTELGDLSDCDLVIEAVLEELPLKREVFAELDRVTRPEAVLATNTSALSVERGRRGDAAPRTRCRHALLQPGARPAARRDRARAGELGHGGRGCVLVGRAGRQAAGSLQRHARVHREPDPHPAPQRLRSRARRGRSGAGTDGQGDDERRRLAAWARARSST